MVRHLHSYRRRLYGRRWHSVASKIWLWGGATLLVLLVIYWIFFIGIWDGPNQ